MGHDGWQEFDVANNVLERALNQMNDEATSKHELVNIKLCQVHKPALNMQEKKLGKNQEERREHGATYSTPTIVD